MTTRNDPTVRRPRKKAFLALTLILSMLLGAGLGELVVRLSGKKPYQGVGEHLEEAHVMMRAADPVLGWSNRPGVYDDHGRRVTVLDDGSRATSDHPTEAAVDRVTLIGGSFVFGHELGDDKTLAWLLQDSDPARSYENHGVSGFGGYQSLLVLERVLQEDPPPSLVMYGLIEHHKVRNVGKRSWLKHLARTSTGSAPIMLPKCDVDDNGDLVRHEPVRYREWPLQRWLASVNLAQDAYYAAGDRAAMARRQEINESVLSEMNRKCQQKGARFMVLLLEPERAQPSADTQFLEESGIEFLDLRFPHTPDLRVNGVGHPNAIAVNRWAEAIRERIGILAKAD